MFTRLFAHIKLYRNKGYRTVRRPDKLAHLSCFLEDSTPDTFFAKDHNNFDRPDFDRTVHTILTNTQALFAGIKPEVSFNPEEMSALKYNVEMTLYGNLVKRMGLKKGWVGDGGYSKDKGKSLKLDGDISLEIKYAVSPSQKLNQALLI